MSENFSERKTFQIEECINQIPERIDEGKKDGDEESIGGIVSRIIKNINSHGKSRIEQGDIFIIKRSNKFYSMNKNSKFWIYYENEGVIKQLDKVMPSREFDKIYSKIAFYIFTKGELITEVKDAFIEVMDDMYLDKYA